MQPNKFLEQYAETDFAAQKIEIDPADSGDELAKVRAIDRKQKAENFFTNTVADKIAPFIDEISASRHQADITFDNQHLQKEHLKRHFEDTLPEINTVIGIFENTDPIITAAMLAIGTLSREEGRFENCLASIITRITLMALQNDPRAERAISKILNPQDPRLFIWLYNNNSLDGIYDLVKAVKEVEVIE